jgi:hypothetical protein
MELHYGEIEILSISNSAALPDEVELLPEIQDHYVRFVHYPDCQQLIIMLPSYGPDYKTIKLLDAVRNEILDERPVTDRLSGSIQILWDTLEIPPGQFRIEIYWKNDQYHLIEFVKYTEEESKERKATIQAYQVSDDPVSDSGPIIYRDGFGNIIPDEAELLREEAMFNLFRRFSKKLSYSGNFRDGTITYTDGEYTIDFYHEMGGGDCHMYINIPTEDQWELKTHTPLSERIEILEFVAETVQREQAPSWKYEIRDDIIYFY